MITNSIGYRIASPHFAGQLVFKNVREVTETGKEDLNFLSINSEDITVKENADPQYKTVIKNSYGDTYEVTATPEEVSNAKEAVDGTSRIYAFDY